MTHDYSFRAISQHHAAAAARRSSPARSRAPRQPPLMGRRGRCGQRGRLWTAPASPRQRVAGDPAETRERCRHGASAEGSTRTAARPSRRRMVRGGRHCRVCVWGKCACVEVGSQRSQVEAHPMFDSVWRRSSQSTQRSLRV